MTSYSLTFDPGSSNSANEGKKARIDGGRQAWQSLCGAFMIEALLYGFPLTFGVFQKYYVTEAMFETGALLPAVGTLEIGISKLCAPLVAPFIIQYPKQRKYMIWVGCFICLTSFIGASFATQLWHLILTLGFLFGIGFLILYYPLLSMLDEWWVVRRGFAYGVLFGGGGCFGLVYPIFIEKLHDHFGAGWALRGCPLLILVLVGPTLPLLQGRRQREAPTTAAKSFDFAVFSKVSFAGMTFGNLSQGLIFFLPNFFISSYAATIGLSTLEGTIILSVNNVTTMVSQIGIGYLADRFNPLIIMFLSTFFSALISLYLCGFSKNLASLLLFGAFYGLFAGGFSVLYCRFATGLTDHQPTQTWLYSIFESQRGVVIIAGGIVSSRLIEGVPTMELYGVGEYSKLILLVGISLLVSSVGGVGWFFRSKSFSFLSSRCS